MAGWCIVTAVLLLYPPHVSAQMIAFTNNLAMAGGVLQRVVLGAGA